jgi:predicted phage-related endonuclease
MEIFWTLEQGTPEWHALRRGVVTASEFSTVLAQGRKKGDPSVTRRKYMLTLISDRIGGAPADSYSNHHMERGKSMEAEALQLYHALHAEPIRVGFVKRNADVGCSPDAFVGEPGMVQVKTALPAIQLERVLKPELPAEYVCQVQGELWVCEREWSDFVSYWPGLPLMVVRVYRDEKAIKSIELGVEMFLNEMAELMQRLEAA